MGQRFAAVVVLSVLAVSGSTKVRAQDALDDQPYDSPGAVPSPYLAVKLLIGVAGEVSLETSAAGVTVAGEDDLALTYGAGVAYMHPLHENFALGAQLVFASWNSEGGDDNDFDRNLLMDLSVVPQGVLPVSDGIDLTLGIPLGLTFDFYGEDGVMGGVMGVATADSEVKPAFGFNYGVVAGVHFELSRSVGLLVELGFFGHAFTHEIEATAMTPVGNISASGDADVTLGQPRILVGVSF